MSATTATAAAPTTTTAAPTATTAAPTATTAAPTATTAAPATAAILEFSKDVTKANLNEHATVERVTLESLIVDCPELRRLTVGQLQQYTPKEVATRFLLRAFTSRALAGSSVDWQDKSIKGAMLSTASKCRAVALEPKANEWKGCSRDIIIDRINEMLIAVHSAVAPATTTTKAATSELDKARKYISNLSAETLAALRKEGVI